MNNKTFIFPKPKELTLRLKDMLETDVDEKYYLTEKISNLSKKKKTPMTMSNNTIEPIVCEQRYDEGLRFFKNNICGTIRTTNAGGDKRVIEPTIKKRNIKFNVRVRKYPVNTKKLCECLRNHKSISNKEIAEKLNVSITKVEHWFRTDNCFAIPDESIWFELKELLNIRTTEFDESIMTFEEKENVFEKAERCYEIDGIAPTITSATANEKIIEPAEIIRETPLDRPSWHRNATEVISPKGICRCISTQSNNLCTEIKETEPPFNIRKLTPKECWRLMGFDDVSFERAEKVNSNTQLYKQAGNSIVVNVLEEIFKNLLKENEYEE